MSDPNKWKNLEISDDEDDTHPNIDTPSLFRWRHEARVKRMKEFSDKKDLCLRDKEIIKCKLKRLEEDLKNADANGLSFGQIQLMKETLEETQREEEENKIWEQNLLEEEKKQPLNIDTMFRDKFDSSQLSSKVEVEDSVDVVEDEKAMNSESIDKSSFADSSSLPITGSSIKNSPPSVGTPAKSSTSGISKQKPKSKLKAKAKAPFEDGDDFDSTFLNLNKEKILKYASLRNYRESGKFLYDNIELARETVTNFLCIHCIDLASEEKMGKMKIAARQTISLKLLLELCKHAGTVPEKFVLNFFNKLASGDTNAVAGLEEELTSFIKRVEERAHARYERAYKQVEEEERKKRIGPGGLDPVEVFNTLPKVLQECFESQDIPKLKEVISKMSPEDARYHMKRCVDSGLWVPNTSDEDDPTEENLCEDVKSIDLQQQKFSEEESCDEVIDEIPKNIAAPSSSKGMGFATSVDELD